jgi:uncharacterized protein YdaU (DUF1376 family)
MRAWRGRAGRGANEPARDRTNGDPHLPKNDRGRGFRDPHALDVGPGSVDQAAAKDLSMNYYEHHIGDYAEATAHLSLLEDGAYGRLIRKYYATERPLPRDPKDVQRLIGCRSATERRAVERVLREFFVCTGDGWHQLRCDEEIERYRERTAKQKVISMMGVEARRNKPTVNHLSTDGITDGQPTVNRRLTPPDSRLQTPDSSHHLNPPQPLPAREGRVGGNRKRRSEPESDWTPPTEEQIRAGK